MDTQLRLLVAGPAMDWGDCRVPERLAPAPNRTWTFGCRLDGKLLGNIDILRSCGLPRGRGVTRQAQGLTVIGSRLDRCSSLLAGFNSLSWKYTWLELTLANDESALYKHITASVGVLARIHKSGFVDDVLGSRQPGRRQRRI